MKLPASGVVLVLTLAIAEGERAEGAKMVENLALSTVLSFESEYIFRGQKMGGSSFQPSLEAGHPLGSGDLYLGVWASQDVSGDPLNEVNLYGGYHLPLTPIFSLRTGFIYYWFPDEGAMPGSEEEPFIGIAADLPLRPSLFAYYNFATEQTLLELSVQKDYTLGESSFFEIGVVLGLGHARDANSDEVPGEPSETFGFGLLYANLIYEFTPFSSASLGVRYSGREEGTYQDFLYWGTSISFGF